MRTSFLLIILMLIMSPAAYSQQNVNVYLLPGQGSDKRIFDSLSFKNPYTIKHIAYEIPSKGISMKEYAKSIAPQIDTSQKFILIGVSLGGMICMELNEILNPEKVIIISSAKSRKELPYRYRFQKTVPIYSMVPAKLLLAGAKFLQPIVEPDRNKNKATFKSMLASKDPVYIKRTIEMIIRWDRESMENNVIHIHGDKDHTLPIEKVQADYIIKNGSHMMTLTRHKDVNEILNREL